MAVALANYMQGFLNRKTALYEYNSSADFVKICDSPEESFAYKNVDYYMKRNTELIRLLNGKYDVVIIDCGSGMDSLGEFMRCDYKLVLSSLQAWYAKIYERFCQRLKDYAGSDVWLHILGCDDSLLKGVKRAYGITAIRRPCIDNAYLIDRTMIEFFQTLFA